VWDRTLAGRFIFPRTDRSLVMQLTEASQDALTELINIGYGRAAASLSQLTRPRISLNPPQLAVTEISSAMSGLREFFAVQGASDHQLFSGVVSGQSILLLNREAAVTLISLLLGDSATSGDLRQAEREVLTEVGNILLNACLGVFGNVLRVQMTFSVPRFDMDNVEDILRSSTVQNQDLQYALMVHTRFHISTSNVSGYLMMVLGVTSLSKIQEELEKWEQRQLSG
jgi:chemotaxis protein CheC